ncbi:hypothetical protein DPM19_07960 [Actinomadura craniellae]|uniref:Uncharacterized protein n=1 Tax=Actinomadura craniellae TaxID=2231787 RepID=A0A365H9M9_9ACTN|nr:hypothetical protein [Actinomadura craniellae]RAY15708.1 hypothetical protein DPM19_07960 [Actinomadura craniellae]
MARIRVGRPDVRPDAPSHVRGIREGNEPGGYEKTPGLRPDGTATARRSTGINPGARDPIDPSMPNLPPA